VLLAVPSFQTLDGKFDPEVYRQVLRQNGQSVGEFEAELRAEGARLLLSRAIGSGVAMPPAFVEQVYAWAGERRSFWWLELTAADLAEPIREPAEADLQAWYDAHPEPYTRPESRQITYAWITPSMLVDKVAVDEEALQKMYADRAATYRQPERRLVERLVFASADEAAAAWDRLQSGATDFDALVAERGLTLDDIDIGDVTEATLGAAGPAVFALTEPGLVGPVDTALGPAIIRMNGILAAENTSFEDAREELLAEYASDRARRMIGEMNEQVNDLLAGGATLEDLAGETDLELGSIDYADAVSEGIAGYAAFRKAALAAKSGDFAEAIELDDGGVFALRLDGVTPPTLRPLAEVRDQVIADWEAAEVKAGLIALADELLPRLENGEDPGSFGLTVNHEDNLSRDAFLADVPDGLVTTAFTLAPGKAARIDGTAGTPTVALVRTVEVLPPDPANADLIAARDSYAAQLNQDLASDILAAFTRAVEATAGIRLDQTAVNAVNAQFQ
jgi:peptidyl-prolyl cis-trans isomerase D